MIYLKCLLFSMLSFTVLACQEAIAQNSKQEVPQLIFVGEVQKIETKQVKGLRIQVTLVVDTVIQNGAAQWGSPFYKKGLFRRKRIKAEIFTHTNQDGCGQNECEYCGFKFQVGEKYLVCIDEHSHGLHIVNGCGNTEKLNTSMQ